MSLFDLSGTLADLASDTITVTRFTVDGYDSSGRATARTVASTFNASASVQPISGRDLQRLPEGFNASETVSIWCVTTLALRDRVSVGGRLYEVQHLDSWNRNGNYCKAFAKALDSTEPG